MTGPKNRGTSLPELLVVIAILAVLLVAAERVVVYGYQFYRETDESITLQRESLLALTRLSQDLTAAHPESILVANDTPPVTTPVTTPNSTLVIPIPKNLAGNTEVDNLGRLLWMTLAGYQVDYTAPERPLMRYLRDMQPYMGAVPPSEPGGTGSSAVYTYDVEALSIPDAATANNNTADRRSPAARNVEEFNVTQNLDTFDIRLTILLKGRVKAGVSEDNSLTLTSTVYSRN